MTSYLIDTNVISELAPGREPRRDLLLWLDRHEHSLFLSVVTAMEIQTGILKLGRRSPGWRHDAMLAWYRQLEKNFADHMLPVAREVADHAARIADAHAAGGSDPDWPDIMIAATAKAHGLTLMTRNIRHFSAADIAVIDPFQTLPE